MPLISQAARFSAVLRVLFLLDPESGSLDPIILDYKSGCQRPLTYESGSYLNVLWPLIKICVKQVPTSFNIIKCSTYFLKFLFNLINRIRIRLQTVITKSKKSIISDTPDPDPDPQHWFFKYEIKRLPGSFFTRFRSLRRRMAQIKIKRPVHST